jgi:hypothetical protein
MHSPLPSIHPSIHVHLRDHFISGAATAFYNQIGAKAPPSARKVLTDSMPTNTHSTPFYPPISQSNANSPTLFSSFIRKFAAFPSIHPPPNFLFHFPFLAFPFLQFLCTEMTTAKSSNSTKIQHPNESMAIKMSNHHSSSYSTMRNSSPFFAISLFFLFIAFLATFPKSTEAR